MVYCYHSSSLRLGACKPISKFGVALFQRGMFVEFHRVRIHQVQSRVLYSFVVVVAGRSCAVP